MQTIKIQASAPTIFFLIHTFDIDPIKADVRNFRQKYKKKFKLDAMFFEN